MDRWRYDAVLVERMPGLDDVNTLRHALRETTADGEDLVSVLPDPRGWMIITRLPAG